MEYNEIEKAVDKFCQILMDIKAKGLKGFKFRTSFTFAKFIAPIARREGYKVKGTETNTTNKTVMLTVMFEDKDTFQNGLHS